MTRLSEEELVAILKQADRRVPIGSRIRHRKSGDEYSVMNIALREEDLVPLVIYSGVRSSARFCRPVSEIIERFTLVTAPVGMLDEWF